MFKIVHFIYIFIYVFTIIQIMFNFEQLCTSK